MANLSERYTPVLGSGNEELVLLAARHGKEMPSPEECVSIVNSIKESERNIVRDLPTVETHKDVVEEIRKYKELLDSGAITKEEYEAKKKQLLNL